MITHAPSCKLYNGEEGVALLEVRGLGLPSTLLFVFAKGGGGGRAFVSLASGSALYSTSSIDLSASCWSSKQGRSRNASSPKRKRSIETGSTSTPAVLVLLESEGLPRPMIDLRRSTAATATEKVVAPAWAMASNNERWLVTCVCVGQTVASLCSFGRARCVRCWILHTLRSEASCSTRCFWQARSAKLSDIFFVQQLEQHSACPMTSPTSTATVPDMAFFAGVFGPAEFQEVDVRFNDVDWKGLLRRGSTDITRDDVDMLKVSEGQPLDYVLNGAEGRRYVSVLQRLLLMTTADRTTQYYAVSRIKGVLTEAPERNARLFLPSDSTRFDSTALMRAVRNGDANVQGVASIAFALLCLHLESADCEPLITWACEQLSGGKGSSPTVRVAVNALTVALRGEPARLAFSKQGGISHITKLLRMQGGDSANAQLLYALCFCLWSLTLAEEGACAPEFAASGAVSTLVEQVAAARAEKVVRVSLAALKNLSRSSGGVNKFNAEMIACGLPRTLEVAAAARAAQAGRGAADAELTADLDYLKGALAHDTRELTTFEAYAQEVRSGRLRWGVVHSEKFWRESARACEADDFFIIRRLIDLLRSEDEVVVAIACYDLGEFVRFYPTGKAILRCVLQ
jgi:V-type H+-transporting ATPase subunit H